MSARRPLYLCCGAAASVLALTTFVSSGASATARTSAAAPAQSEVSADDVADMLNTMGTQAADAAFGGVYLDSNGTVQLSLTAPDPEIAAEVTKLESDSDTPIVERTVTYGFSQLESTLATLVKSQASLASDGLTIQDAHPDPRTDLDQITISDSSEVPQGADVSDWARTVLGKYVDVSMIEVSDSTSPLESAGSRDNDPSPFYGGDGINLSHFGNGCTSGFVVVGNSSGNNYLLTDAHCGPGAVTEAGSGIPVASVTKQYFNNSDVETIGTLSGYSRIWQTNTTSYSVTSITDPAVGTYATINGDVTGEKSHEYVAEDNGVTTYNTSDYGSIEVFPVGQLTASSQICAHGDSGGPVYTREDGGADAWAAGLFLSLNSSGTSCHFAEIGRDLALTNTSMKEG